MSQAIAQSATKLTVSNHGEENYDAQLILEKVAAVSNINGATREKWTLNRTKLMGSLCNDYRARFAAIYGGRDEAGKRIPLPDSVANKLRDEVDKFIETKMRSYLNVSNVTHQSRQFAIDSKTGECYEKVQITGRNIIHELKEQRFGQRIFRNQKQAQLDKLEEKAAFGPEDILKRQAMIKFIGERDAWIAVLDQQIAEKEAAVSGTKAE